MQSRFAFLVLSLALAVLGAACSSVTCGDGTELVGEQCVLQSTFGKCAPGTKLVSGECKLVCAKGTAAGTNGCIVDDEACGAGTELVDGACVPADLMKSVTTAEGAEPNEDAATALRFVVPAVGADAVVLGGTIVANENGAADFDAYAFSVSELSQIRVDAVAVGAPSVGVVVERVGAPGVPRLVASLESRSAVRDIVLPTAGEYVLRVTEATNLFRGGKPRGSANFTYLVRVTQLAAPSSKQISSDLSASGLWSAGELLEIAGSGETQVFEVALTTEGEAPYGGLRGLWAVDAAGRTMLAASDRLANDGTTTAMDSPRLVVPPTGVKLLVDPVIAFTTAAQTQRYGLKLTAIEVREVSAAAPRLQGEMDAEGAAHVYAVELEEGTILTVDPVDIGWDLEVRLRIYDASFTLVAESTSGYQDVRALIGPGRGGRCFIILEDREPDETDTEMEYDLKLAIEKGIIVPPVDIPGTASASGEVPAGGAAWFILSSTKTGIARVSLSSGGGAFTVDRYNGLFAQAGSVEATNGTATFGRLPLSPDMSALLRVSGGSGTVNLDVETSVPTYVAEREPNDRADAAQVLTLDAGGSVAANGRIKDADIDLFRIDIAEPGVSELVVETDAGIDGSAPDTYLRLLSETGTELKSNDDVDSRNDNFFSRVSLSNAPPGTYFIEVKYPGYAAGGKADKGYTVYVTTTP